MIDFKAIIPDLKSLNLKFLLIVSLIAACITIPLVSAAYVMTSNTVQVTGTAQATLSLISDKSSFVVGSQILLSATVSDQTPGITINFLDGSVSVGTSNTNSQSIATLTLTPQAGQHNYTATGSHP